MATITGGDKLNAALSEMAAKLTKSRSVEVGFPSGATYSNGKSVGMVAAIQEFGAPAKGIPARPFFRTMIEAKKGEWPETLEAALKANDYDVSKALDALGAVIQGQLQESILDFTEPALSAVTVMLRGMRTKPKYQGMPFGELMAEAVKRVNEGKTNYGASTKPLEDTGTMLNSISYRVNE